MSDIFDAILNADGFGIFGFSPESQWGLFRDGESVIAAESVTAFEFKQDYPLSTYQVEEGGFETYDKVEMPWDIRLQFVAGGDQSTRQALIESVMAIKGDLNTYDAVTPDQVYLSCNVTHVDYRQRNNEGVGLIRINVYLVQIRVAEAAQYNTTNPITKPQSSDAADQTNNGTVQASDVSSSAPNIGTAAILQPGFH